MASLGLVLSFLPRRPVSSLLFVPSGVPCSVGCQQHAKEEATTVIHVAELIQALMFYVFVLSEACWNVDCELLGFCFC